MQFVLYSFLLAWVLVESTKSTPSSEISNKEGILDNNTDDCNNNQRISLNFSNIVLSKIGDDFIASSLITCLNLRGNGIKIISPSAFDKLTTLTYLDLSDNNLYENPNNILSDRGHKTLKTLILDNSFYSYHGTSTLTLTGAYPSLEKLYVRNNVNLQIISGNGNGDFSNLAYLYLSNNNINRYERRWSNREVSYDDFSWLPKSLKYLELDNNNLRTLSLMDLQKLEFLSINTNKLETLSLQNLNSLKHFSAYNNEINDLSYNQFQGTPELEDINLTNNRLSDFDGRIVDFIPNLQNLSLENNFLTNVPEIRDAPKLHTLSLRCNKIKQLRSNHFSGMPNLRILRLDNNEIVEVHANSFFNLQKLEILSLGRNNLTNLPSEWMMKLQNLRYLHLEENQFKNLEALQLNDIPSLMQLFLQNNPLKYLRASSLDSVPENVTIELDTTLTTVEKCEKKKNYYNNYY